MRWQANPVLVKEMRSRMRGVRAFVILTVSLLLLASICALVYAVIVFNTYSMDADLGATVGRTLFATLAIGETLLVCVLTPGLSAGAISGEDELKTLEMLLVTPLKHHTILWGKLLSSLAYVGLLVLVVVPLGSLILLFGGVSPVDLLLALLLLAVFALSFSCLGLFCSAAMRRTGWARGMALATVGFITGGTAFLAATVGTLISMLQGHNPLWMLVPNPIAIMVAVVIPDAGFNFALPAWVYALMGYLVWTALLYVGTILLLRHRRSGHLEGRGRGHTVLVMGGLVLLTLCGFVGVPVLLTWISP